MSEKLDKKTPWEIIKRKMSHMEIHILAGSQENHDFVLSMNMVPYFDEKDFIFAEERAAFIIKAANCHDELVIALEALLKGLENINGEWPETFIIAVDNASDALAKARGK